ncbi:uncharacterized [Tachysurus ichikawai]
MHYTLTVPSTLNWNNHVLITHYCNWRGFIEALLIGHNHKLIHHAPRTGWHPHGTLSFFRCSERQAESSSGGGRVHSPALDGLQVFPLRHECLRHEVLTGKVEGGLQSGSLRKTVTLPASCCLMQREGEQDEKGDRVRDRLRECEKKKM